MYKRAKNLKSGDVWIDRIGCLHRITLVVIERYGDEEWVTIHHPNGSIHSFKPDKGRPKQQEEDRSVIRIGD